MTDSDLPHDFQVFFDGSDLGDKQGIAALAVSSGPDGWPHTAMLSVGEVVATSPTTVRLATWRGSRLARDVRRSGRLLLEVVLGGRVLKVELETRCVSEFADAITSAELMFVDARVRSTREDAVPYARVTGGLEYELVDPGTVVDRWLRTVDALQAWEPAEPPVSRAAGDDVAKGCESRSAATRRRETQ